MCIWSSFSFGKMDETWGSLPLSSPLVKKTWHTPPHSDKSSCKHRNKLLTVTNGCRTITGISVLQVCLRHWHKFGLKNIIVAWTDTAVAWIKTVCDLPTPAIQIEGNGAVCQTTDNIRQNRYRLVPTPRNNLHRNLSSLLGRTGVVRQKLVGYVAIRGMKCEGKLNRVWVHNL